MCENYIQGKIEACKYSVYGLVPLPIRFTHRTICPLSKVAQMVPPSGILLTVHALIFELFIHCGQQSQPIYIRIVFMLELGPCRLACRL